MQLQKGCITTQDVLGLTDYPIIKKNTTLTDELIAILETFLVQEVEIEPFLANGKKFTPMAVNEIKDRSNKSETNEKEFIIEYLETVKAYKKLFLSWQAGLKVEMYDIRKIFVPLFNSAIKHSYVLPKLHHYSNKEDYLYHHCVYVGILAAVVGKNLHLDQREWLQIGFGGALADAGMARVAPTITKKAGALTAAEFEDVKKHPIYSYKMLMEVTGVSDITRLIVLQHHERYDGSGYPFTIGSKKIHLFSQIVAVADVYHAMTSERYYRIKRSPFQVLEDLSRQQFGKFDVRVIEALLQTLIRLSNGDRVRLTSGEEAEIMFVGPHNRTKPIIKIKPGGKIIDLNLTKLHIEEIL
ncbi:HD-GYP domain-containing protein [Halalkalibacter krulwichiae]|uniref:HD-GYP domain-containing protein n=1 Tax=Halalkalibacter krulwichiae TaxID=199441 RepID=UPI002147563E|nr:HD-GYP domain-containing protein [Halalkalibacter krulwichiae]